MSIPATQIYKYINTNIISFANDHRGMIVSLY